MILRLHCLPVWESPVCIHYCIITYFVNSGDSRRDHSQSPPKRRLYPPCRSHPAGHKYGTSAARSWGAQPPGVKGGPVGDKIWTSCQIRSTHQANHSQLSNSQRQNGALTATQQLPNTPAPLPGSVFNRAQGPLLRSIGESYWRRKGVDR